MEYSYMSICMNVFILETKKTVATKFDGMIFEVWKCQNFSCGSQTGL